MGGDAHGGGHGGHHGDDHHDDHHHHEAKRVAFNGQPAPYEKIPLPPIGSREHLENIQDLDTAAPVKPPRSLYDRFAAVLRLEMWFDPERPTMSYTIEKSHNGWFEYLTSPLMPLRPKDYVDAYTRPNPCPEEYWTLPWKWPRTKMVNPKIPPPVAGKYNDYYHYLAFRNWFAHERDVYVAATQIAWEALGRCAYREGQYNGAKNCRHLFNKAFAMSRMEEFNQALTYMAMTGNCAIRETPYPEGFVDEKRKVYDDWLTRTRMRKPGDVV